MLFETKNWAYLSIVVKISFEYVLNNKRIGGINLIPKRGNQPVSPVFCGKIRHVVVQPIEVHQLMKNCAANWMILFLV